MLAVIRQLLSNCTLNENSYNSLKSAKISFEKKQGKNKKKKRNLNVNKGVHDRPHKKTYASRAVQNEALRF